jgi:hypothetical protein
MNRKVLGTLVLIWIAWFVILYFFQWLVSMRLDVQRPDTAVSWSASLTTPGSEDRSVYLENGFMNNQVAWDSEYYLGIATGGYNDPLAGVETNPRTGQTIPRNYSFFPLYPFAMKALADPLRGFGLGPIPTSTLAGILISLLGTLAGMIALYDLARGTFDAESGLRAVFYMLIFPTAFFFAQIYTEGLFIGLAFWSLALLKRGQWFWASLLGMLATWTRAHGAALALPLGVTWLLSTDWETIRSRPSWKWVAQGLCALLPVAAFLIWRYSVLGKGWAGLQEFYFGRGLLAIPRSIGSWAAAFLYALTNKPAAIYFGLEVCAVLLALVTSLWLLRRDLPVALFSLAVVVFSVFSGSAQSMARYMLVAPAMFMALGALGRSKAFDRAWTIASLLLMGMSAMLFTFKMWVG